MDSWILFPVGIAIASIASLLGIGGGIVWVPFLILVMDFDPHHAIMLSFGIQIIGMGSASIKYIAQKRILWKLTVGMLPFIVAGVFGGSFLSQRVAAGNMLELAMGIFSMFIAIFFAFQSERYYATLVTDTKVKSPIWLKFSSVGFAGISGLLSIGIGDVLIPILRAKLKVPMQNAVGTALFLNFSVTVIGASSHFFLSKSMPEQWLQSFGFAAMGVAIGGQLGGFLSERIDDTRLKEMFVILLMLIGLHMIYQSL